MFQEARPASVSETEPAAVALAQAIAEARGEPGTLRALPGYPGKSLLRRARGPQLRLWPRDSSPWRMGPKEYLKRRDLEDVAVVYALTASRLLAP